MNVLKNVKVAQRLAGIHDAHVGGTEGMFKQFIVFADGSRVIHIQGSAVFRGKRQQRYLLNTILMIDKFHFKK